MGNKSPKKEVKKPKKGVTKGKALEPRQNPGGGQRDTPQR